MIGPDNCRICLSLTETYGRVCLFLDDGNLSPAGNLFEDILRIEIAASSKVVKFICNSCELQLKLFKELKSRALESETLLGSILIEPLNKSSEYTSEKDSLEFIEDDFLETTDELCEIIEDNDEKTINDTENMLYLDEDEEVNNSNLQEEYLLESDANESLTLAVDNVEFENISYPADCFKTFEIKSEQINNEGKERTKSYKEKKSAKSNIIKCPICPKKMYSEEALEVHLNIHNGLPAYKCDICEKTFKQKIHYKYHMSHHRNERNIICDMCQKGFISKSDLKIHMRVHSDERPYSCDICGKTFRAKTHMICHRYSHFEKQFECPLCKQKYVSPNTLRTHYKTVHKGEVPFKCQFCEKRFKRKHHLHAHFKTHRKDLNAAIVFVSK